MKKMKNLISALLALCLLFCLSSCSDKDNPDTGEKTTTAERETKPTGGKPVKLADIPDTVEDRVEMLNSALDYIDIYCYKYKKSVKCSVSDLKLGDLSKASNAGEAFRSIFGEKDIKVDYDYKSAPESFAANLINGEFTEDDVANAEIEQKDDNLILTVKFYSESAPADNSGALYKLSGEYQSAEKVRKSLSEFNSSADSIDVSARNIVVTATIRTFDSGLEKLTVSYDEKFSLENVKLVQLEGSSVSATSKTTITYSNME